MKDLSVFSALTGFSSSFRTDGHSRDTPDAPGPGAAGAMPAAGRGLGVQSLSDRQFGHGRSVH